MSSHADHLASLPPEQRRIRTTCYHPTGVFTPFPKEAIEQSITARFEEMVRLHADRLAVKHEEHSLTYEALNQAANRIAHAILERRGEAEEPVGVLCNNGISLVTGVLGALKAGKIYVPLDPCYPQARLRYMVQDSQSQVLVTDSKNRPLANALVSDPRLLLNVDQVNSRAFSENPGFSLSPDRLATLVYTSGSTGQPKGVLRNHRGMLHSIFKNTNDLHMCLEDRHTLLHSPSASGSSQGILLTLLNGASLFPCAVQQEGVHHMATWLTQENITIYRSAAPLFRSLLEVLETSTMFPRLRIVYLGSEAISLRDIVLYKKHCSPACVLINSYGASEASIAAQYFIDQDTRLEDGIVPAGYATQDTALVLLDADGHEVECNAVGEIAIKSRYISLGYWGKPEMTRSKFLTTADGQRMYLTGDFGRRLPDGCLIYLGRRDFQVKIRGFRIEVTEIEAALQALDNIREVVVTLREDRPGDSRLVAYIVCESQPSPSVLSLRRALAEKLPEHMIPTAYAILDALPLTPNGKVDRLALPAPSTSRPLLGNDFVAPRTPIEKQLATIWMDILHIDRIGIHDLFLDLGGHSLLATQLLARIIETFQVDLPLRILLESPSIADMAVVIAQHQAAKADPHTIARLLAEVEALTADDIQRHLADPEP